MNLFLSGFWDRDDLHVEPFHAPPFGFCVSREAKIDVGDVAFCVLPHCATSVVHFANAGAGNRKLGSIGDKRGVRGNAVTHPRIVTFRRDAVGLRSTTDSTRAISGYLYADYVAGFQHRVRNRLRAAGNGHCVDACRPDNPERDENENGDENLQEFLEHVFFLVCGFRGSA